MPAFETEGQPAPTAPAASRKDPVLDSSHGSSSDLTATASDAMTAPEKKDNSDGSSGGKDRAILSVLPKGMRRSTKRGLRRARTYPTLARTALQNFWKSEYALTWLLLLGTTVFSVLWVVLTTFLPEEAGGKLEDGAVCLRPTVCATDTGALILLGFSRVAAYAMYPSLVMVFLVKCNNMRAFLARTYTSVYVPLYDLHVVHSFTGRLIFYMMLVHAIAHIIRWSRDGDASFLYSHVTGRTGVAVVILGIFIIIPMWLLKTRLNWEIRFNLHKLSFVFGIVLAFHAPQTIIGYIMGITTGIYLLDLLIGFFYRTHRVLCSISKLETGVLVTFRSPRRSFSGDLGYVSINLPWIKKSQWHPFTVYQHPTMHDHSCLLVKASGDWTKDIFSRVAHTTTRLGFVRGPYPSPYSCAVEHDKLILCASGIGITPALSILTNPFLSQKRRANLIWVCRDGTLVQFVCNSGKLNGHANEHSNEWILIYYTGKEQLVITVDLPPNVFIFRARPQIRGVVSAIIFSVESGIALPEDFNDLEERTVIEETAEKIRKAQARKNKIVVAEQQDDIEAEPAILPEKAKVAFQSAVIEGLILFGEDLVSKYDTDSDDCITVEEFVTTTKAIAPQVVEEFGEHNFRVYTEYTFQVIKEKRSMQGFGSDGDLVLRDPSFHGRGSISIQAFNDSISEVLDLHRSSEKDRARLAPVQESDREFGSISGSESGRTSGLQESQTDVSVIVEGTSVVTEDEPVKPQQTLQRRHTSTSSMKQDKDKQDKAKPQSEHTLLLHGFANQLGSRAEELEEKLEELNEERFDEWQILYCGNAKQVVSQLSDFSKRFEIQFRCESFDW